MKAINKITYSVSDIELVFRKLIENTIDIRQYYYKKIKSKKDKTLAYVAMGDLARLLLRKKRKRKFNEFKQFFLNVEMVLANGDKDVENLIVTGLFESLQNMSKEGEDYYTSFNKWLAPKSLLAWRKLIDFWEGEEWRMSKEDRNKRK